MNAHDYYHNNKRDLLTLSQILEFAEAYHRAKVEAVTKNQIKKEASKCWLPADFEAGAKYVKDKLLNQ